MSKVTMKDNSGEYLAILESRISNIAEAIGLEMERHAKVNLNEFPHNGKIGYVDTGRAKNSITHTYSGKESFEHEYKDDNNVSFSETIPACDSPTDGKYTIFVGSNVEYFYYLEAGTVKMLASHSLQKSIEEHKDEYMQMLIDGLKKPVNI